MQPRPVLRLLAAAALAGVLAGCLGAPGTRRVAADDPGFTARLGTVAAAPEAPGVLDTAARLDALRLAGIATARPSAADPVWLSIPAIGVESETLHLDLTATEAEVPESFHVAGWYRQTAEPGTPGVSVVVGHVGSRAGPGIFDQLDRLRAGDEIHVRGEDDQLRTFVVTRGQLVDKEDRPADVFGASEGGAELRLITCGGEFSVAERRHLSNYVIWAREA